jgi:hypothetical protein
MDGKPHFRRTVAPDRPEDGLHLQAFWGRSDSNWHTNTVPASYSPRSSSGPRLDQTRAMRTAP